jgi:hypothetical protein
MKKQHRKGRVSLPIIAAALGLALTFTACGKTAQPAEKAGVKLLETITYEDGDVQKFEYDEQNRIVKIGNKTITYADNLVTVGTQKYAINGKTITVDGSSFTINEDGYIVNRDGVEYEYNDGNLIEKSENGTCDDDHFCSRYSYDNKKSLFSGCTTPKWLIQHLLRDDYASKNNSLTDYYSNGGRITYKYKYDSDGFPTKETKVVEVEGTEDTTITYYTYYGGLTKFQQRRTNQ